MAYKALVIGCGNIGAGYDLHTDEVTTHAKAFHLDHRVALTVADVDGQKAQSVAAVYNTAYLTNVSDEELSRFDIVSLCVSTQYHYEYLSRLVRLRTPLVICEKPVAATLEEVELLEQLPLADTRIVVNYIRRFQPGFIKLRKQLAGILQQEQVLHIEVRYQRGLLNNGGHALDLLQFLLDKPLEIDSLQALKVDFDAFADDPTATIQFLWNGWPVSMLGFPATPYTIFEIDIFTTGSRISITESGNIIRFFCKPESAHRLTERVELQQNGVLNNYMIPVVNYAIACLEEKRVTNFSPALDVNRKILQIISKISRQSNG